MSLWCRLGFHRYGPWVWDEPDRMVLVPEQSPVPEPRQHRACQDCLKKQGPLVSSEERRYWESWRDRTPVEPTVAA